MEGINLIKKPKLKNPYMIVAWPGMGDVAFKAAAYLVDGFKAEAFAEILPQDFFYLTGSTIDNGVLNLPELPQNKFYYWKNKSGKNDLIIFMSNAQPDLAKAESYCRAIIEVAGTFKVDTIISLAALPQPIDHTQSPNVWFAATSKELGDSLKKYDLKPMTQGQISGMNGLFLGIAKKYNFKGFCLLSEIPLYTIQIENPKASYVALKTLGKILDIQINLKSLEEQIHIVEDEINKLFDYLKLGSPATPIGEEEIEKIKKSLGQLTKLPASIKEKIEKLFDEVKNDISKANELKSELDKWNVYKDYEDRFLDLFKKSKDKSN